MHLISLFFFKYWAIFFFFFLLRWKFITATNIRDKGKLGFDEKKKTNRVDKYNFCEIIKMNNDRYPN